MKPVITLLSLAAVSLLSACASVHIDTTGTPLKQPVCRQDRPALNTVVYWGPQWRPDQKEPALREAAAGRGLQDFLNHTPCLAVSGVHRLPDDADARSDASLLRQVAALPAVPDRVLAITVRELGPRLTVGLPGIVAGGTEVLVDVRVLDPRQTTPLAQSTTFWRHGGSFVIKGVGTLAHDMRAALQAALMAGPSTPP